MLKPTVKRGLMLDFIPDEIMCPAKVNPNRVFKLNNKKVADGDILYVISRELRFEDNWAVQFGLELAEEYSRKFKILINLPKYSKRQEPFLFEGLNFFKKNLALNKIDFEISQEIPKEAGALIFDFNPLFRKIRGECAVFEVDSHNIIPARFISQKQEYSAATLRRKIYANIAEFLTEFPSETNVPLSRHAELVSASNQRSTLDRARNKFERASLLKDFIANKLDYYAEFKNNPEKDITSGLSPYLHFGFISSQRVVLEVIKSKASRENKEAFLEELIVRKELADNFCLYGTSYNTLDGISSWAKETLNAHRRDIRTYIYTLKQFEHAQTHDDLWNKIQQNLLKKGKIHGYLRMYWAKKILEWSKTPENALKTAIYLNDTYALDGKDSNGYVGILWSIGGLHDRPFTNRFVTGKIRYMSGKKN